VDLYLPDYRKINGVLFLSVEAGRDSEDARISVQVLRGEGGGVLSKEANKPGAEVENDPQAPIGD